MDWIVDGTLMTERKDVQPEKANLPMDLNFVSFVEEEEEDDDSEEDGWNVTDFKEVRY